MIVLDTHAWIWFVSNPKLLSVKAKKAVEAAVQKKVVYISSISVWEVAHLVMRNRLKLTMQVSDWIHKSELLPFMKFVPVTNSIALRSVNLPTPLHNDPADRIIIATAMSLGAYVVTKDEKIRNYTHVKSIW
jgi:PIN domain nuclease of toxin-antitoxin system